MSFTRNMIPGKLKNMKIFIGSDHAGFDLKHFLMLELAKLGYEVIDCGPTAYVPDDDYPQFCIKTAENVIAHEGSLGIVIGGSGNGEQIAANKVNGIRCALAWSLETAALARKHNDAQIVSVGARMHEPAEALEIVKTFLNTEWSKDVRHLRRIKQITAFEQAQNKITT